MKKLLVAYSCLASACMPGRLFRPLDLPQVKNSVSASWRDFGRIPESGSAFSIQLFVRLAVRRHPQWIIGPLTGSVGHVFLALEQINDQDSIVRYFGFYPKGGFPGIFNNKPVAAVLADNPNHRYDAALRIMLTQEEFYCLLHQAEMQAGGKAYQIYNYNCVDFAVQLINEVKGSYPLKIPLRKHSLLPVSCHTPEDLFQLIKNKKRNHEPKKS